MPGVDSGRPEGTGMPTKLARIESEALKLDAKIPRRSRRQAAEKPGTGHRDGQRTPTKSLVRRSRAARARVRRRQGRYDSGPRCVSDVSRFGDRQEEPQPARAEFAASARPGTLAWTGPDLPDRMPEPAPPNQPRLLDRVRHAIRARHYSLRTEEAYVGWIRATSSFTTSAIPPRWASPRSTPSSPTSPSKAPSARPPRPRP